MTTIRREDGSALIASVLVTLIVAVLGALALQIATHTNDATTLDRLRAQSIQAAEAGVNETMRRLETNPAYLCDELSDAAELHDGANVLSKYQVRVEPPPGANCTDEEELERVIRAWGFAPVASERSLRHLQVGVKLIPQEGFRFALFASTGTAEGEINVHNSGTADGDLYAERLTQTHNNIDAHDVITPYNIQTKNNASYTGTLWAGGNVLVGQNSQIGDSILAAGSTSTGNVGLENGVVVGKDVRAKGSVTLGTTTVVEGSVSQNNPSVPPPPMLELPRFTWDPTNYDPSPQVFSTADELSGYLDANSSALEGTLYTDDPSGLVEFDRNTTVTGPLTIVTTGKVALGRTMDAVGGPWQVVIVSLSEAEDAITISRPFTGSPDLEILLFAEEGGVQIQNNASFTGAVYANDIGVRNRLDLAHGKTLASHPPVGFDFTQASAMRFAVVPVIWREIVPGPPPS